MNLIIKFTKVKYFLTENDLESRTIESKSKNLVYPWDDVAGLRFWVQ